MADEKQIATVQESKGLASGEVFSNIESFEAAQRMAQALASSRLVPTMYQGNTANCLVALSVSRRLGVDAVFLMSNMDMIHGRPSLRSTFIISMINSCGRFSELEFEMSGEGDNWGCVAIAKKLKGGKIIRGPRVSISMAKAEGWYQKSGSKWQTMPELMLQYRAATFFGRLHAPDVLNGMNADDESRDMVTVQSTAEDASSELNKKVQAARGGRAPSAPREEHSTGVVAHPEPEVLPAENIQAPHFDPELERIPDDLGGHF